MGKVRVRQESKKLFIDFRYDGQRFREQTLLDDNAKNRKQLEQLLQRMEAKMLLGEFNYAEFFPNSSNLQKLKPHQPTNTAEPQVVSDSDTPFFNSFSDQWFDESKIQWRAELSSVLVYGGQ
ncbi:DUF3596 domain-containing protein [Halomonas sp. KX33721]|jgi:integrase|uniref:Arm DNA-binding domain-containing protein n=1 Tax=Halomonas sp. KX33721 TaxID=1819251 RepID=UPI000784E9A9|nr:DUF3596 domain-containing protein [Halomonas sp. KX33721]